jgi:signal transduction histidine kinase
MRSKLFQKTTLQLTGVYLVVLMAVSIVFSMSLYRVLSVEVARNYDRSVDFANRFNGFRGSPLERAEFIKDRLDEKIRSEDRLKAQLFFVNIIVLGSGGVLSYALARRTLHPVEEAHAALERFTSDASHELRTPLATMQTEIEVALMNEKLTAKDAKKLLHSNLEEVQRLTHLSERLLVLARLEEASLPLEHVRLGDVLNKAALVVQPIAEAKNIDVHIDAYAGVAVRADQSSLTELFVILLDNAIKYSSEKTMVRVVVKKSGRQVNVAIVDQGAGIAVADQDKIFDRFYRADSSRTGGATHGYGLGLSLAQKIAQLHGATIRVKSKPGKGSTFTVSLEEV